LSTSSSERPTSFSLVHGRWSAAADTVSTLIRPSHKLTRQISTVGGMWSAGAEPIMRTIHSPTTFGSSARARVAEIGHILALGLVRLKARQSSQMEDGTGESSLDCVGHQSGDETAAAENGR
jgi:hypothetical protein